MIFFKEYIVLINIRKIEFVGCGLYYFSIYISFVRLLYQFQAKLFELKMFFHLFALDFIRAAMHNNIKSCCMPSFFYCFQLPSKENKKLNNNINKTLLLSMAFVTYSSSISISEFHCIITSV